MNEFNLPPGYAAWCHICGETPFNKVTTIVLGETPRAMNELQQQPEQRTKDIPGVGFKSLKDMEGHKKKMHQEWKG